MFNNNKFR